MRAPAWLPRWVPRTPANVLLVVAALGIGFYVIAYPLLVVHYPPITDLPFHAAAMSILRHYGDADWHFREQFSLHFLEAPYWTMWGLGAVLAYVFPVVWAAKISTIILLSVLPIGLAILFHGMRKSPLLGLLGLAFVWNSLTHWGFINFVSAIGMFCMTVGATLLVLDRPTRWRQVGLTLSLLLVFGTHIFRFPFAIAAVVGTTIVMWPATRRWKPILAPTLPWIVVLVGWMQIRNEELKGEGISLTKLHTERLSEVPRTLFGAFAGYQELDLAKSSMWIIASVALGCLVVFVMEHRWRRWSRRDWWWTAGVTLLPLCMGGVFLLMFLTLPIQLGTWWYVYPREILTAAVVALALFPNLPRLAVLRIAFIALIGWAVGSQAFYVAQGYYDFDKATADFREIKKQIPKAPRLGYMIYDHSGSTRSTTPFIHLPAWVQAEHGGWLSFHFMGWKHQPIRYRDDPANVPPETPLRFEWTPDRFDIRTRGKFFDWFLVRSTWNPQARFNVDPSIKLVAHEGTWWLFRREGTAEAAQ